MGTDTEARDLREQLQASLGGAYALGNELGGGGMARVFVAEETTLGRRVVVKVLPPELSGPAGAERFRREADVAAGLQHPHIVPLLAAGESGGLLFYTMPLVDGETLRARLARDGALALPEAVRVLRDVTSALAYAHRRGVVHRDIKPENVLLGEGGDALVTDFGLAKALAAAREAGTPAPPGALTSIGVAVGTPAYMAPEQAAADPATDHRADLYALGVVAYEVLAGSHPFARRPAHALLAAHAAEAPELLTRRRASVPADLAALVMHLLEKHPADRPQSAEAVLQALDVVPTPRTSGYSSMPSPSRPEHVMSRPGVRLAVGAVVLALAGYGGYTAWRLRAPVPARPATAGPDTVPGTASAVAARPSVAVLPFVNTSRDPAEEHFSDGLTDELIGALGKVAGLRVTGRTSTFALKGTRLGVRAVAETLGVRTVVEGSWRRSGSRLRVGTQLVSAADGAVLWTETYDRETRDVFAVQEEIAGAIVAALRGQLGAGVVRAPLVQRAPADLATYELYLKGQYVLNSRISRDGLQQAIRYFDQAVARDASYARAHAGLSQAYTVLASFGYARPHQAFARAKAAAHRALALDSTLAEAHAALAHTLFVHDFDWSAAEREFRRALALDPANPGARRLYALLLQDQGHFDRALAHLDTARASDPLAPLVNTIRGRVYVNARRPAEAIRPLEEALALSPDLDIAYQQLGHAYLQQGKPADAITALRRAAALSGLRDSAHLAYAYGVTGQRAEAARVVRALLDPAAPRDLPPFHLAMAYAGLGDKDAAFQWLERGYMERGAFMDGVKVTPAFASLHSDPRWAQLLRRMGLER